MPLRRTHRSFCWFCYAPAHISLVMRKPVFAICKQQRCRSACTSAQYDQHHCYSLPKYYTSSFYVRNFKPLASFCGCAGQIESYPVANPEDRFSHDEAHILQDLPSVLFSFPSSYRSSQSSAPVPWGSKDTL